MIGFIFPFKIILPDRSRCVLPSITDVDNLQNVQTHVQYFDDCDSLMTAVSCTSGFTRKYNRAVESQKGIAYVLNNRSMKMI